MDYDSFKTKITKGYAALFESEEKAQKFCDQSWTLVANGEGYINLDDTDVLSTIDGMSAADIRVGIGTPDDLSNMLIAEYAAIQASHPGLEAKSLLIKLDIDPKGSFTIDKTAALTDFISSLNADIDVIWGIGLDNTLDKDIRLILIEGLK